MRQVFLLLLLLTSQTLQGAISLVSNTSGGFGGLNGGTSSAIDSTGANFLVVALIYQPGSTPVLTDSKSNTWTLRVDLTPASKTPNIALYECVGATVGTGHTVTISGSVVVAAIHFYAFAGVAATSPFDLESNASAFGPATSLATGSITPSEDGELVISLECDGALTAPTSSPITETSSTVFTGGSNYASGFTYEIQTTATARNITWSNDGGDKIVEIASYKAAAGSTVFRRRSVIITQ